MAPRKRVPLKEERGRTQEGREPADPRDAWRDCPHVDCRHHRACLRAPCARGRLPRTPY